MQTIINEGQEGELKKTFNSFLLNLLKSAPVISQACKLCSSATDIFMPLATQTLTLHPQSTELKASGLAREAGMQHSLVSLL